MRVALLLTGQLRGFHHAIKTWGWFLPHVTDVYYHLLPPKPEETPVEKLLPNAKGKYIEDLPGERHVWINPSGVGICVYPAQIVMGHQFYSLQEGFKLITGTYDWVIRCRPDSYFGNGVDFTKLRNNRLYVPRRFSWGGINDRFGIGNQRDIGIYCNLYDHMNDFIGSPICNGNSEVRLARHLLLNRVHVRKLDLDYYVLNNDGSRRQTDPKDWGMYVHPTFCEFELLND